jgi:phosphate-selective porin OprO/OprP
MRKAQMKPRLYHLLYTRSIWLVLITLFILPRTHSQEKEKIVPNGTEGIMDTVDAATGKIVNPKANDFDGSITTFRIGLGFIYDFTTYAQSEVFKEQMGIAGIELDPRSKTRDFRILGSGVLKTKRSISWKFAYMWDGDKNTWMVRETGVNVGVPELKGNFFIGRTKEGFSMIKVMNGHSPWGYERQIALDVIPILADGIKYMGYYPKAKMFLNLGYFNNWTSKGQGFATFKSQVVARVGWLPILDQKNNKWLHIATSLRYGKPKDDVMTLKSRPESNPTPQLINTGQFATDHSFHYAGEVYYTNNRLTIGSEVISHHFYLKDSGGHVFNGGNVMVAYSFTGGTRPYNTNGGIYGFIRVKRSVFKGGLGEIEGVITYSTLNLNSGPILGGKFWRLTPMINWYLSKNIRWEFIYGFGNLDRYDLKGNVQFFESRIQFTFM